MKIDGKEFHLPFSDEDFERLKWAIWREMNADAANRIRTSGPRYGTGIKNGGYILGQWGARRRPWYVRLALWLEGP
jgi:hypothetical protein